MPISLPNVKRKARIEIIPLIDVVFFLLATFVMVSMSMVKNQGLQVRLPSAVTAIHEARKSSVTVTITEGGDVYLNKEKLSLENLKIRLSDMKTDSASKFLSTAMTMPFSVKPLKSWMKFGHLALRKCPSRQGARNEHACNASQR